MKGLDSVQNDLLSLSPAGALSMGALTRPRCRSRLLLEQVCGCSAVHQLPLESHAGTRAQLINPCHVCADLAGG